MLWCGWRTNTYALQQAGWQIAVEQSNYDMGIRLLLLHRELQMRAITNTVDMNEFIVRRGINGPSFRVANMASEMRVQLVETQLAFREIDARPQAMEFRDIDAFEIFAVPLVRTEEIIVDQQDVSVMLEQIRRMQSPIAAEIRQRDRRREREIEVVPREVFHAQILSIAA